MVGSANSPLEVEHRLLQLMFIAPGGFAMILTTEQAFLKSQSQYQALQDSVTRALANGQRIDQVERDLLRQLLELGHSLLMAFVAEHGDGDEGPTTTAPDGQVWQRLPQPHTRRYVSIFGELIIDRFVYGRREGQKIESVPVDRRLGLPAGEFSYVYEDWAQRLCVRGSFAEASQSLECLLGLRPSVRTLEHMNRCLAEQATSFEDDRGPPPAAEEGAVLVVTADGKGVPMRRPLQERVRGRRRGKGEKANKKQMAYVGAVYSIERWVRTCEDVVGELRRQEAAAGRPRPQHKRVWTEMTPADGPPGRGRDALFEWLADGVDQRNPQADRPVVCLFDGERWLWEKCRACFPDAIAILDLFHVLEKLWLAAHCFHTEGSAAAAAFVTDRLRMLLEGRVGYMMGGLRQMSTKHQVDGAKARTLQSVLGYFENNRDHMRYDSYLAAGYPIGSGVAEGACRHVVKDRMEGSGMRWTLEGAQAMLDLRAIYLNDDWDAFVVYRIQKEQAELNGQIAA